ncbi:MAG: hypothetical protein ACXAEU_06900 [Candidatus Hodarchaeales archaeon]|jgi:hypothetical protein
MSNENVTKGLKGKDKLIRLQEVFRITNRTEENIRAKIETGLINKYDKHGKKLANPLQETGFFKLFEVLNAYGITDHEKTREEFIKKRLEVDSVIEDIIPAQVRIITSLDEFATIPDGSFDTCLSFFPYDLKLKTIAFSRKEDKHPLEQVRNHRSWMKEILRILDDHGNYLVHSTPELLPYYAVYLDKHATFKYWIVNKIEDIFQSRDQLRSVTNGTLFYIKSSKNFRLNRIRETILCDYCGKNVKDYGGKKLLIHRHGSIISDVWKHITEIDGNPSDELIKRLINISCNEDSTLLLAPFRGELHDRYGTKSNISG